MSPGNKPEMWEWLEKKEKDALCLLAVLVVCHDSQHEKLLTDHRTIWTFQREKQFSLFLVNGAATSLKSTIRDC